MRIPLLLLLLSSTLYVQAAPSSIRGGSATNTIPRLMDIKSIDLQLTDDDDIRQYRHDVNVGALPASYFEEKLLASQHQDMDEVSYYADDDEIRAIEMQEYERNGSRRYEAVW
ncbi:predicted protein [Chaetoceros tenuissimus]|uniref:PS II complex 12 kDa extrinsic protein n=1 Tax=Chaetoceros tenuissimus TaxID=426638 RepID=A0AAD3D488_9STRA|nr:predicted protein [Chaetoceros tenuissimus]